jgi:hypothetical protein
MSRNWRRRKQRATWLNAYADIVAEQEVSAIWPNSTGRSLVSVTVSTYRSHPYKELQEGFGKELTVPKVELCERQSFLLEFPNNFVASVA